MKKKLAFVLLSALLPLAATAVPQTAFAQDPDLDDAMGEIEEGEGDAPLDEDDDFDGGTGAAASDNETPRDPNSVFAEQEKPDEEPEKKAVKPEGYPMEEIYRPVNLLGGMSEIALSIPLNIDPVGVAAVVRGDYGITDEIQLGLRYGLGRVSDGEFATGKAVAIDFQYLFHDNIAAQLSVPFYLDPFALAINLGAPMRFSFFDTFTLEFGRDLVSIRVAEFIPSIENATQNDGFLAKLDTNEIVPAYIGTAAGSFIYQVNPNMAADLHMGISFDDLETTSALFIADVGLQYSTSKKLDFGARLGSTSLASFTETFALSVFTALRI